MDKSFVERKLNAVREELGLADEGLDAAIRRESSVGRTSNRSRRPSRTSEREARALGSFASS